MIFFLLDHTNVITIFLAGALLLYTRSLAVLFFCGAAGACTLSVKHILKRLIRQPRPPGGIKVSYGMPSTHSATIAFFAAYNALAVTYTPIAAPLAIPVVTAYAVFVAASRLWLGHHTVPQVIVGALYGIAFAGLAFTWWINDARTRLQNVVDVFGLGWIFT